MASNYSYIHHHPKSNSCSSQIHYSPSSPGVGHHHTRHQNNNNSNSNNMGVLVTSPWPMSQPLSPQIYATISKRNQDNYNSIDCNIGASSSSAGQRVQNMSLVTSPWPMSQPISPQQIYATIGKSSQEHNVTLDSCGGHYSRQLPPQQQQQQQQHRINNYGSIRQSQSQHSLSRGGNVSMPMPSSFTMTNRHPESSSSSCRNNNNNNKEQCIELMPLNPSSQQQHFDYHPHHSSAHPVIPCRSSATSSCLTNSGRELNPVSPPTCVPWLKKIKVIKKIQRKIGIGSRTCGMSPNNMPPLLFHNVHGENVTISQSKSVAKRNNSFCKAIAFSDRPVKIAEKVCIKFTEVSFNWSGVLRIGFTSHDPASLRNGLPRYACPDLTSRPGFWAKAFSEFYVKKDAVLFYYTNAAGDVHFGINGEEKGVFFSGIDTKGPLWAMLDIYGNTTCVEFVDPRGHLNNSRASINESSSAVVVCTRGEEIETSNSSSMAILPSFEELKLSESETKMTLKSSAGGIGVGRETSNWSVECVACCERPVDSVFYSCGHMCMCYSCAVEYWKTKEKGCCPICRAAISDVIRTYKS